VYRVKKERIFKFKTCLVLVSKQEKQLIKHNYTVSQKKHVTLFI